MFWPAALSAVSMRPTSKPIQVLTKATVATGAAVLSTRKASFSLEIRRRSVRGRMPAPTTRQLA